MRLFLILIYLFFSNTLYSKNILTININEIINNNSQYLNFLNRLNDKKAKFDKIISMQEEDIQKTKEQLENEELLLSQEVFNTKIDIFNKKIQNYQIEIQNIDNYMKQNILYNENLIIQSIAKITTQHAKDKNIDLILNENNYFIASNDIDISDLISTKLENIDFNFLILDEKEYFED